MRAVRFEQYGGPEVLEIADVEEPHPGPGRIRIRVHAAGVNAADWKVRSGRMARGPLEAPRGTGMDAAGVVDELGEGVTDVAVGDRVFGSGTATVAELAVLADWAVLPDHVPFEEGAAAPVPVETAVRVLHEVGAREGDTLAIAGAAGGVGTALIQIARARGLIVIGTASAANQEYVEALGALATTYDDGWPDRVRALAVAEVDCAADLAGKGAVPDLIALTGDATRVVSIADAGAAELGARTSFRVLDKPAALREAAALMADGRLRMIVEQTYPLEQTPEAQRVSEAGHVRGRAVIEVAR